MVNHKSVFLSIIICTVILNSCQNEIYDRTIVGNTIKMDFKNISLIANDETLLIDDLKIEHSVHEEDWKPVNILKQKDEFSGADYLAFAPSSELHLFEETTGRRFIEKNSSFLICNKVGKIFLSYNKDGKAIYKITNGQSYLIDGTLEFQKVNGEPIRIRVNDNYPVRFTIIN